MSTTARSPFPFPPKRLYLGRTVPMRVIRRYARAIADEFQPDRIILFGSYAYGMPHADSDVDLLVVIPAKPAQPSLPKRPPLSLLLLITEEISCKSLCLLNPPVATVTV